MQAITDMISPGLKYTVHIDANNANTEMNSILHSSNIRELNNERLFKYIH